jgi:hypothetical protein
MKYTFISKEGPGLILGSGTETERTVTFNAHQLDTVLEEFELFLKGCGFVFDGHLDIISEEDAQPCTGNCKNCICQSHE